MNSRLPMQSPQLESDLNDIEVPLYIEPFIAWRAWSIDLTGSKIYLRSITYKMKWPHKKPMRAHCLLQWRSGGPTEGWQKSFGTHCAPNIKHGCGIHTTKQKKDTQLWNVGKTFRHFRIVGEVNIWGKTLCYEKGFVAEFAYPRVLHINPKAWENVPTEHRVDITPNEMITELSEAYDVPCVVENEDLPTASM